MATVVGLINKKGQNQNLGHLNENCTSTHSHEEILQT